ncbi:MAG: HAD family hydrolase [Streptosporangiaceae bacterium]
MTTAGPGELAALVPAAMRVVPLLSDDIVRIPACFHSFDQHPADVEWLVNEFRQRYSPDGTPVCVVGVRTSGCYLGPLHAAGLRATGYRDVSVLTFRPSRPFRRSERAVLRATARSGGHIVVVDDPPGSGRSLAATGQAIASAGVPRAAIVFMLSLFPSQRAVAAALADWPVVVQPWEEWAIHSRLAVSAVRRTLGELVHPDLEVADIQRLSAPQIDGERGHARARFAVWLTDGSTAQPARTEILVEGAGLGYLGRQGLAVARALPDKVPRVYGFADGLLYQHWLGASPDGGVSSDLADTVADYVVARQRALAAPNATTSGLGGRDPVWEVAAMLVSRQYGRLAPAMRPLLLEPVMRRLLGHHRPTVVDSNTSVRHWRADASRPGELRKTAFYQRTYGHLEVACYDAVFDLAGAAADGCLPGFEARLRSAYEKAVGEHVDGERWLLYRLAHIWRLGRAGDLASLQTMRHAAGAVHDYLAELYLHDLPPAAGPLCAVDLDGVLECDSLGYPATSPTGVLALRALIAHGYRPILVSGRSLLDVSDRCCAFGLAGGVAEYGAILWADGRAEDLRPQQDRDLLARVRGEMARLPAVRVDAQTTYAVRASTERGPVPADLLASTHVLSDPAVCIHQGQAQTDITTKGFDKGTGLAALSARLGAASCALAVGDGPPDLPMFARSTLARAPRNADLGSAAGAVRLTAHAYQRGLADACADLLGHRPGRCPACGPPAFAPRTRALLAILDLRSNGFASVAAGSVSLGVLARNPRLRDNT